MRAWTTVILGASNVDMIQLLRRCTKAQNIELTNRTALKNMFTTLP